MLQLLIVATAALGCNPPRTLDLVVDNAADPLELLLAARSTFQSITELGSLSRAEALDAVELSDQGISKALLERRVRAAVCITASQEHALTFWISLTRVAIEAMWLSTMRRQSVRLSGQALRWIAYAKNPREPTG